MEDVPNHDECPYLMGHIRHCILANPDHLRREEHVEQGKLEE
jgi:hypothetical protein